MRSEDLVESDVEMEDIREEKKGSNDGAVLSKLASKDEVTTAELLAHRHSELQKKKFRIGLLCSGLLESPESKVIFLKFNNDYNLQ